MTFLFLNRWYMAGPGLGEVSYGVTVLKGTKSKRLHNGHFGRCGKSAPASDVLMVVALFSQIGSLHFILSFVSLLSGMLKIAVLTLRTILHTHIYTLPSYFLLSTIYIMNITSHV